MPEVKTPRTDKAKFVPQYGSCGGQIIWCVKVEVAIELETELARYQQAEMPDEPEWLIAYRVAEPGSWIKKEAEYIDALRAHDARMKVERDDATANWKAAEQNLEEMTLAQIQTQNLLSEAKAAQERAERTKLDEANKWQENFKYLSAVLLERSERLYAEKLECHAEWCRAESAERRLAECERVSNKWLKICYEPGSQTPINVAKNILAEIKGILAKESMG
jgi:hypothetical protein